jgi:F420-dependent oxidoreductase-like protein
MADTAPGLEFGTAVIPTFPRHPTALAGQALTAQAALGDRPLVLGVGLSHRPMIEGMLGLSFDRPVRHLIDYLEVLQPLLETGSVAYAGEAFTAHIDTGRPTERAPSVMVAALGEQTLKVAGHRTDGTILWMVGPRTVAEHICPRMTEAAAAAGREAPRIVCSLPTCVTDDAGTVRDAAATVFEIYGQLPSYRAMLDREGARHPGDVAIVGTEDEVAAQLAGLADAGVTDFSALEFGTSTDELVRTRALLKDLL